MILINKEGRILDVADKAFPVADGFTWVADFLPRDAIGLTWDKKKLVAYKDDANKKPKPVWLDKGKSASIEDRLSALEAKLK